MEVYLTKAQGNMLMPACEASIERITKMKLGALVKADIVNPRNPQFHRKFFSLRDVAYEYWEPPELMHKDMKCEKNQERFRKDLIIAAGFYDPVIDIAGNVRAEPHSMSFGSMEENDFDKLYNAVINVVLARVMPGFSQEDVERIMNFT